MAGETVYSSSPLLRSPRRFLSSVASDMRLVPTATWRIFVRDQQARHRQTRLGYLLLLVPTLAMTLIWVYLSNAGILKFGHTTTPYVVFVLSGIMLWQVFVDSLNAPISRLSASREVLKKGRVPHESWILVGVLDAALGFVVRLVLLIPLLIWDHVPVGWTILAMPLAVLALVTLGLAIGLALTPVGLLYQDVGHGLLLASALWFFLTPVIYPAPGAGAPAILVHINPVTPLLVTGRAWLTGETGAEPVALILVTTGAMIVLLVSWILYRLSQPHLVARL